MINLLYPNGLQTWSPFWFFITVTKMINEHTQALRCSIAGWREFKKMEDKWKEFWKKEHGRDYETIGDEK